MSDELEPQQTRANASKPRKRPNTESYLEYLNDLVLRYGLRRAEIAQRMGKVRSWATQILNGNRALSPELAEKMSMVLPLKRRERIELVARVAVSQSNSPDDRARARYILEGLRTKEAAENSDPNLLFQLSKWYVGAILEMANCEGYEPDPAWIAGALYPRISEDEVHRALNVLRALGFLGEDGRRRGERRSILFGVNQGVTNRDVAEAYDELHRTNTQALLLSFDDFRRNERTNFGGLVALDDDGFEAYQTQLRTDFERSFLAASSREALPNRLYRVGIYLAPASDYTDVEVDSDS